MMLTNVDVLPTQYANKPLILADILHWSMPLKLAAILHLSMSIKLYVLTEKLFNSMACI